MIAVAGVPVISLNSGYNVAAKLGALTHVGQTEYEAGEMAGQFFINRGVKSGLCLVHEQDNSGHHQRCGGFKAALTSKGLKAAIGNIGHKTDVNIKVRWLTITTPLLKLGMQQFICRVLTLRVLSWQGALSFFA